jgi:hypothetical protein
MLLVESGTDVLLSEVDLRFNLFHDIEHLFIIGRIRDNLNAYR